MHIIDNKGKRIEITDLYAAIKQVELFTGYFHSDARFKEFDADRKAYWEDVLTKLNALCDTGTNQSIKNN